MSSLFSGGGSIDIPAGRKSGRARGKFGRMAGEIVKAIGGSSPTVGLTVEPRDKGEFGMTPTVGKLPPRVKGEFEKIVPRVGKNPPSIDEDKLGRIG